MADLPDDVRRALADRYPIARELGRGGMATVYLATDTRYAREVAVKVLKADLAAAVGPDRFLREIRITAQLNHPHILPLLDSGDADGILYYVMPYVSGGSLRRRLRGGQPCLPERRRRSSSRWRPRSTMLTATESSTGTSSRRTSSSPTATPSLRTSASPRP